MCKYPIFIITISFITDIVAKYEIQCYNICVKKEKIMLIGFLFLIINIAFIIISIVKISKKQKSKVYGIVSLIVTLLLPFVEMSALMAIITPSIPGESGNMVVVIPIILSLLTSIANIVLSCIILPKGNEEKQEKQVEMEKVQCRECSCEAEEISKTFANTTEKGKMKVGNRQWFDIYTTFNITYKCPQCGKTWTENKKEKTGKKLKKYDKLTRTWVEYDDAIF